MEQREDLLTVVAKSLIIVAEIAELPDTANRVRKALIRYTNRFDTLVDRDGSPVEFHLEKPGS